MSVQDRLALVSEVIFIDAHLIRVLVLRRKESYKNVMCELYERNCGSPAMVAYKVKRGILVQFRCL